MMRVLRSLLCLGWMVVLATHAPLHTVRAQDDVSWLLGQINSLRASQGLPAYSLNAQLSAAATQQSQYLAETCNIAHVWPDGQSPQTRAAAQGYTGNHIIENIYAGTNATAADAWNFWMNSPVHYAGLVNATDNEIGIGVAHGGLCGHAFTLVFGRAGDGSAPPPANPAVAAVGAPPPYVPPPPTHTPTETIPTLTPSATWTLTPTYTPSPTFTAISPTATPLSLPTVAAVAVVSSPTAADIENTPTVTLEPPSPVPPTPTPVTTVRQTVTGKGGGGMTLRDLVPFALVGQIILIGIAGFVYFRKAR
jgi:hypothetical protein